MAKFKKGDRVRFIEEDNYDNIYYLKGSEAVVHSEVNTVVTLNDSSLIYADKLKLITDYQPITPKVGEMYRVVKQNKGYIKATPGIIITLLKDDKSDLPYLWSFSDNQSTEYMNRYDFVTTEYLELVEEELPVNRHVDIHWSDKYHPEHRPEHRPIKKTKLTTMQKLTSALKRVLSADKQTLYKAGVIGGDLELSPQGKEKYVVALFNNEGDHKKAVAEMVAMAQTELDEA